MNRLTQTLLLTLGCLLLLGGCDPEALRGLSPPARDQRAKPKQAPTDPDFTCKAFFWARSYSLVSRLAPGRWASYARLSRSQQKALDRLIRRSEVRHTLKVADGRVLVTMPRTLSPPRTRPLELLLAEDLDRLVLFSPQRKLRFALPLSRLPDVLDGTARSRRAGFELILDAPSAGAAVKLPVPAGLATSTLTARVSLSYFPDRKAHRPVPMVQTISVALPDDASRLPWYPPTLLLALPLLQSPAGLPALESLAFAMGRPPLSWSITTADQSRPREAQPTVVTQVFDQGYVRVPRCELAQHRKDYRDARTLLHPPAQGLQRFKATDLAGLRGTRAAGPLQVTNHSASTAYVYVDGALLGWVAPGAKTSFTSLPAGYYRLYARSPLGVRAWGPRDVHVPGPLTLE